MDRNKRVVDFELKTARGDFGTARARQPAALVGTRVLKYRRNCPLVVLAGSLVLGAASYCPAQGIAYGIDLQQQVFRINLSNASSTPIGIANGGVFECLGMDPIGDLYGITTVGDLYRISTVNAAAQFIGNTGLGNAEGMDWDSSTNQMLISEFSMVTPSIYSISLSNASTNLVQTATSSGSFIRTIATRNGSPVLDVRRETGGNQGDLHGTYNLSNGAFGTIGTPNLSMLGIDYGSNNVLYGLVSNGALVTINPGNGLTQPVGMVNQGSYFLGMATPVPEPGAMAALGLCAVPLLRRRHG